MVFGVTIICSELEKRSFLATQKLSRHIAFDLISPYYLKVVFLGKKRMIWTEHVSEVHEWWVLISSRTST